jgi:hypothetical protein
MKGEPDFFLTAAAEMRPGEDLARPRACWTEGRLRDQVRDDYMLIRVDPPVIGQAYGLGNEDIAELIIAARWKGYTLFPVTEWGCSVYVMRILDESISETSSFAAEQIEVIAWANIHRTREEAEAEVERSRRRDNTSRG